MISQKVTVGGEAGIISPHCLAIDGKLAPYLVREDMGCIGGYNDRVYVAHSSLNKCFHWNDRFVLIATAFRERKNYDRVLAVRRLEEGDQLSDSIFINDDPGICGSESAIEPCLLLKGDAPDELGY